MPDKEINELKGHDYISETTIHGLRSLIFGIPFLAAGILILFLMFKDSSKKLISSGMPYYLLAIIPAFFVLGGAIFFIHGLKGIRKEKKKKELQRHFPDEPWKWDYSWDHTGTKDVSSMTMYKAFRVATVFFLFLLPFNWLAFLSSEINTGRLFWKIMVGLFDLATLIILVYGIYLLIRRIRYGVGRLRFNTFPFFLGKEMIVIFHGVQGLDDIRSISATLRFIEERYGQRGNKPATDIYCYQLYADMLTFQKPETFNKKFLTINFALPEGDLETRLGKRPPKYWELEIKADAPGVDYKAAFLLPVYKQLGSAG